MADPKAASKQDKAAEVAEQPERKPGSPITDDRIQESEFAYTTHIGTAYENTEPGDLLATEYWAHRAAKLRPWDEIKIRANDGSWYAHLLVLESGRNWARVHMLSAWKLTTSEVAQTQSAPKSPFADFRVEHMGPHAKWCVIRRSDNQKIHEGAENQDAAMAWLKERIKAGI